MNWKTHWTSTPRPPWPPCWRPSPPRWRCPRRPSPRSSRSAPPTRTPRWTARGCRTPFPRCHSPTLRNTTNCHHRRGRWPGLFWCTPGYGNRTSASGWMWSVCWVNSGIRRWRSWSFCMSLSFWLSSRLWTCAEFWSSARIWACAVVWCNFATLLYLRPWECWFRW